MRVGLLFLFLLVGVAAARADPPSAPSPAPAARHAPPLKPAQAAEAALAAVTAKDAAALKALAARDDPDPWLVADELIRRGALDVADAFARAAPRVDVEGLPTYVASRRGKPDAAARRARLAAAGRADRAGEFSDALEALGAEDSAPIEDVVGVQLAMGRGWCLAALAQFEASAASYLAAGEAAERLGWLSWAVRAYNDSASSAVRGSMFVAARDASERDMAISERRGDRLGTAKALGNLGLVHWSLSEFQEALATYERALSTLEALGDKAGAAATLGNIGSVHSSLGDFLKALAAHERALATKEALGDQAGAAMTLGNIGNVHHKLANYPQALSAHERALSAKEALGDKAGAATTLGNLGSVHLALGDYAKALEAYERARGAMVALGDKRGQADMLGNTSIIHWKLGDYAEALATAERARSALESLGDRAAAAGMLANIGNIHSDLGDFAKALSAHERARSAMEALGDRAGAAKAIANIGNVYNLRGDYAKALLTYERALSALEALGDRSGAAAALSNLGTVYNSIGDYAKALATFERAFSAMEALGEKAAAAKTLGGIGDVHSALGDHAKALLTYERALSAMKALRDKGGEAAVLGNMGLVHSALGNPSKALAIYERALSAMEALGDKLGVACALGNIGSVHFDLGDPSKALSFHERAFSAKEALGDRAGAAMSLGNLGIVHCASGDFVKALAVLRRAASEVSLLARGLGAEESAGARERLSPIFDCGIRAALGAQDPAELAFHLESGRAGALLEGLRARETLWAASLPEDLRLEEASARAREALATNALRLTLDQNDVEASRAARAELDLAHEQVGNVVSLIQRKAKAGAALVFPEPATLPATQATLGAGDAFALFALLDEVACALVVTREDARIVALGATADLVAAVAAMTLDRSEESSTSSLEALRRLVVEPLGLTETTRRVFVSPAGALSIVPFAALMPERTVVYEPSGTTYRLLLDEEQRRGSSVLALGEPDYTTRIDERVLVAVRGGLRLVSLPGTREEVLAVGDEKLLGSQATEAGLRAALARRERWRAVHFACHGLVNPERPALSSLAVTPAGDDDGFLTCLDVFRMKIPADLVVLSACETGKGKVVGGEGLVGFTRAFMFAGAPRVICSLWKVDDAATKALMVKFYELWYPKDGSPGLPTAEALRRAQEHVRTYELEVRDAEASRRAGHAVTKRVRPWEHPYYWAAWALWGLPS